MKLTTMCYVKNDGKTLMLYRNKKLNDVHEGKWVGLGGKMELGESPEDCIIREVKEESGLTIKRPVLRGILTFPKFKDDEDWYMFLYTANEFEGELTESDEGDLEWIEDNLVNELNMWEGDRVFLSWLSKNKLFSGKLIYDDGKLVKEEVVFY
ncbi:8-oxo-dGTP diphosphatase MutX [Gottschalkia purinilytica]|uniref:8-oxo-dGTP diphosphatase MutX n=1 Tax=Gottschalkia purinilytica TaxID=1503 RepID=A0A0L0WEY3_GOTPU|nr:8-oxo-dGTP diphosphatase [Gottschalkia purinilytica]KNF09975.1 8-oxo-dGTP diphosphatase MutX [Gottschalkia purinilytica]